MGEITEVSTSTLEKANIYAFFGRFVDGDGGGGEDLLTTSEEKKTTSSIKKHISSNLSTFQKYETQFRHICEFFPTNVDIRNQNQLLELKNSICSESYELSTAASTHHSNIKPNLDTFSNCV